VVKRAVGGLEPGRHVRQSRGGQHPVGKDGLHLVKADLKELGPSDDPARREEEVAGAIRFLLRGINLKKSTIIANTNCPHTAIKKIVVPYMPKPELREALKLQAKNYFPFPIDKSLLDFEIMGDIVEKGVRKYDLVIGTCPINTVDSYLSLLKKAPATVGNGFF